MSENDEETTLCKNCRRQIGKSNFVLHEMHCKRNISLCEHCNEPIPRAEMEVHFEEIHAKIPCPKCNKEVEKQHLESHEEDECLKRPIKCIYCEMDVAKGELEEHQGYCGTRTENCIRCGQFIMVKDMAQHEESRCNIREIQPKYNNNTPVDIPNLPRNGAVTTNRRPAPPAVDTSDDFLFGSGELNSFQMDEIQRLLGVNGMGPSHQTRVTPSTRTTARGGTQAVSKSKKKEVNIERRNRNGEFNHSQNHDQTFLPCEFCGEAFPIDMLVLHQGSCTEDQLSSLMADTNLREDSDNRTNYPIHPAQRPIPNVIDNLHGYDDDDSDPTGFIDDAIPVEPHDDLMLPCEFCDELFPQDVLVQHQAVCDSDALKTPRVMSPAVRITGATPKRVSNTLRGKPQHTPNINAIIYGKDHHAIPPGPHSRDLDHTLRKYGSSSFDVYGTRGQHQTNESENISPPSPRRSTSRTSVSSAARTRKTLGSLLSDNDSPILSSRLAGPRRTSDSREATGSFVGSQSSRKNNVNLNNIAKQTAYSSVSSSRVPGAVSKRNDAKKTNTGASRRDYLDPDLEVGNLRPSRSQRNSEGQYLPSTPGQSNARQRDRTFDYGGDRTSKNRNPTKRRDQY
ncbi:TRAF-type zinc finger domain-containing protein 1-like isoform X2 [Saccostrea echinata]|uniref:TRAF-type zinc finger domain-containing protein 1-like isoform X2 n=1 Tax=Saccostrea echinata TaxID=191078 RepID=UPI002A839F49|nr:TRAF-type zinc finger domain-containing protein 1-like isoform X2 [Saccostrea echinata]